MAEEDDKKLLRAFVRELKAKEGLAISEEGVEKLAKARKFQNSKDVWNYLTTVNFFTRKGV